MRQYDIKVVGAGIAGLATAIALARDGHKVSVLETQQSITEIGAGVQVPPNASRILVSWGLREAFAKKSTTSSGVQFKRYSDGNVLGVVSIGRKISEHDLPNWTVWRPDYQQILYEAALEQGVAVNFDTTVHDPSALQADLVVLADGIGSKTRTYLLPSHELTPIIRGCAYRILIPRDVMLADSVTADLMEDGYQRVWIGPGRYIMSYSIAGGRFFNMVLVRPGSAAAPGIWNRKASVAQMREDFSDFEPVVQRLLEKADSCIDWTIARLPPLQQWRSGDGRMVLIGDAAHAMTPDYAQGAAMCIEDAAVLADCLRRAGTIPDATEAFESLRKERTELVQKISWDSGALLTLPDGDEQQKRDQMYEQRNARKPNENVSGSVSDSHQADVTAWVHGLDVLKQAEEFWSAKNKDSVL